MEKIYAIQEISKNGEYLQYFTGKYTNLNRLFKSPGYYLSSKIECAAMYVSRSFAQYIVDGLKGNRNFQVVEILNTIEKNN